MFLTVNRVRYYYEEEGEGTPLLCLHGFMGSHELWYDIFKVKLRQIKLMAIDLLGHGLTEAPLERERYSIFQQVEDLRDIIEQRGYKKINLLGYSMGGRLALAFALRHSNLVDTLFLEGAAPGIADLLEREKRLKQDLALAQRVRQMPLRQFVNEWNQQPIFSTLSHVAQEVLNERLRIQVSHERQGLALTLEEMSIGNQPSFWQELELLANRTILIVGEMDEKFLKINTLMKAFLPRGELCVIPQAGHCVHLENKEEFLKTIITHIG